MTENNRAQARLQHLPEQARRDVGSAAMFNPAGWLGYQRKNRPFFIIVMST
jgi:hypothetical protein